MTYLLRHLGCSFVVYISITCYF